MKMMHSTLPPARDQRDQLVARLTAIVVLLGLMLALSLGVLIVCIIIGVSLGNDEVFMMNRLRFGMKLAPRLLAQTARTSHNSNEFDYIDPAIVSANSERRTRLDRINALMESIEEGQSNSLTDEEKLMIEMFISDLIRIHEIMGHAHSIAAQADIFVVNATQFIQAHALNTTLADVQLLVQMGTTLAAELVAYTRGLADGSEALRIRFKK